MKTFHFLLAVLGLVSWVALRADDTKPASRVDVVYANPEKFTDVKDRYVGNDGVRDEYLGILKKHIEAKADKYIPAGQHLVLRITDIKMAGDFEPWHGPNSDDIRIIKDIYPPRINLGFKLTDATGKILKEGERKLTDLDFLSEINVYPSNDTLRYEKALLDDWFYNEFGKAKS